MLGKWLEFFNRHATIARYVPLVLWIGVIFFMSSGEASSAQTSRFIRPILEFLFPNATDASLELYHAFIRKCAHFTEYGILAVAASAAFRSSRQGRLARYWFTAALGLVVLVASLDEFNQSFNPARTGSPWDVLLDTAGGSVAIIIYWLIARRRRQIKALLRADGAQP